ncbi:S-layer homology domain-containing protein [Bacillus infantis]|uniref:S-layer homology domain-containing protein n=1 Tax=Bacillus infantis TaxID=324767 RepID=UPI00215520D8|nr:S-layer homology domain-containing protein [Bacillus infantis]MCR6612963.1 S-layer homology domain-containing protein [Bacillus infantis]
MAYQSKNHRKFLATSLTAAMVASAVAPAVSAASFPDVKDDNFYATYVNQLADAGIIEGMPNGTFGLREKVTRAQAAKMVSLIRGLDTANAPAASFEDVKQDAWYADYINALYAEKLVDGVSEKEFAPNGTLTRAQFAKLVVDAYGLELKPDAKTPFTDVKEGVWYTDYVKTLYANGLINGKTATTFEPNATIDRADFAKLLVDADVKFGFTLGKVNVTAVSATNPTTLTLTGSGLKYLTAEDVTVEGNKVVKVTSTDGRSATVTLEGELAPTSETNVTVKKDDFTQTFKVKFDYKVDTVTIADQTFDDDRAGQKVVFKINGSNADVDYLKLAGYTVTYVAKDSDGKAADGFFADSLTNTSSTGVIAAPYNKGDYTVEVQVTKAGEALVTDTAAVKIVNLDAETSAVETVSFYNFGDSATDESNSAYNSDLAGDDFKMNSTTLVAGEKAKLLKLVGTVAGEKVTIPEASVDVSSSNEAVVSVDDSGVLTAESAGTATVTLKVGNATKTFNFTVTNTDRKLSKVTSSSSSVKTVVGYNADVTLKTLDQYGDPFAVGTNDIEEVVPTVSGSDLVEVGGSELDLVTTTSNSIGSSTVTLTGNVAGKGTVYFKSSTGTVLGSFLVDVSAVDNTGSKKLEIISSAPESTDNTLDIQADDTVTYQVSRYNTQGVYLDAVDLANYQIQVVDGTVATVGFEGGASTSGVAANEILDGVSGETSFVITGQKAGKTDVLLKDTASGKVEKVTITVVNDPIEIKGVSFKTIPTVDYIGTVINYADVLDVTVSNDDDILNGVTLTKNSLHKVRISEDSGTEGVIYLDTDADGNYTSADTDLGLLTLTATASSDFTGAISNSVAGFTTASGDKGTLLFKVLTDVTGADVTTAIAGTSVTVDVK